jgi:hypothetical protein
MRATLALAGRVALPLFLLWHAAAIFLCALPRADDSRIVTFLRGHILPIVAPYLVVTSQWQEWDLFSGASLAQATAYAVEGKEDGTWRTLVLLDRQHLPFWRHPTDVLLPKRILEVGEWEMEKRYLRTFCEPLDLPNGMHLRLRTNATTVPVEDALSSRGWWAAWSPVTTSKTGNETTCENSFSPL